MIIKTIDEDIFKTKMNHITFAINKEGINDSGFARKVSEDYWPELRYCGQNELGNVISKTINGKTFHALVCHSLDQGWGCNQRRIIEKCFNNIDTDEQIASVAIGNGFVGFLSGADIKQILCGMYDSDKEIVLYSGFTLDDVITCYNEENGYTKKLTI